MQEKKTLSPFITPSIKLVKLTIFDNNQIKCYYDDNTSLIINSNYSFITYFLSSNQIVKLSLKSPVSYHNLNIKLDLAIKIINKFSLTVFPYKSFYEKDDIFLFSEKINDFRWYIADDFFTETNECYLINSIDNLCTIRLLKNLRFIIADYFNQISGDKGGYQYIRVQKLFPVTQLPENWLIPLQLLILKFNLKPLTNMFGKPNVLPTFERKEYVSGLPQQESSKQNDEDETDINPLVFIFSKINRLKLLFTEEYTYFINKNEIEIYHNMKPLLNIYTTNEMMIIYYQLDYNEEIKNVEVSSFMKVTNAFSKKEVNLLKVVEIVLEANEIKKFYMPYTVFESKSNIDSIDTNKENNGFSFNYDELYKFKEIQGVGSFYSYANKTVKINFVDRTILKLNSKLDEMIITDKFGETFNFNLFKVVNDFPYKIYLDYALQFYNWCFSDNETKRRIYDNVEMINHLSQNQINQNIIFNTINNPSKFVSSAIPDNMNKIRINEIMAKNEEFLKSVKKYK